MAAADVEEVTIARRDEDGGGGLVADEAGLRSFGGNGTACIEIRDGRVYGGSHG